MNANPKASCRGFFRHLNILPFYSQYIFSLLLLVVKNIHLFVINTEIHTINTWQSTNLHLPSVKLTKYKKGVYYMGIVFFNHLPRDIRELSYDVKKFKLNYQKLSSRRTFLFNKWIPWMVSKNKLQFLVKAQSKRNYTQRNCLFNMYYNYAIYFVYYYCVLNILYCTIWNIFVDYILLHFDKVVSYNCFYYIQYI
jgi:hypothetical protein